MKLKAKLLLLGAGVLLMLLLGPNSAFLGLGLLSSDPLFGAVLYCTLLLTAVMLCCTAIIVSYLKKRGKNDPGDKDADDK